MKKIIGICLLVVLICTGCQKSTSYIKTAEEYGYLRAFDGITWGMTQQQCKKVLKFDEDSYNASEKTAPSSDYRIQELSFVHNFDSKAAKVTLVFNDCAPFEEGTEWLANIYLEATSSDEFTYEEMNLLFKSIFADSAQKHDKTNSGGYASQLTIEKLEDGTIKDKAVQLAELFVDEPYIDNEADFGLDLISELQMQLLHPLDQVTMLPFAENYDSESFESILIRGTSAALLSLSSEDRPL